MENQPLLETRIACATEEHFCHTRRPQMSLSEHAPSSILCVPTLCPIRANAQISSGNKEFKLRLLLENEQLKPFFSMVSY